ncbi:MAG: hypothetical protein SOR93_09555 [Clostridiales Family XIII bacterium]|nr:hypothetical protein [Clostridia bacterium]MDY3011479.1 hypothetical protein [Clostridiales Family XIII bacterium]
MTLQELNEKLNRIVPCRYKAWKKKPPVPFAVYYEDGSGNFSADGSVYVPFTHMVVELYADEKDPELEGKLQTFFDEKGIYWEKSPDLYIESEKLLMVAYSFTMKGEGHDKK